jgi:hypothetical protein
VPEEKTDRVVQFFPPFRVLPTYDPDPPAIATKESPCATQYIVLLLKE